MGNPYGGRRRFEVWRVDDDLKAKLEALQNHLLEQHLQIVTKSYKTLLEHRQVKEVYKNRKKSEFNHSSDGYNMEFLD